MMQHKYQHRLLDSLSSVHAQRPVTSLEKRNACGVRSVIYARGHRTAVVSFPLDSTLHDAYAVSVLGERALVVRKSLCDGVQRRMPSPQRFVVPLMQREQTFERVASLVTHFATDIRAGFSGMRLNLVVPDFSRLSGSLSLSPRQAMYAPLVGAMTLGIVSAVFVEHLFGAGVYAGESNVVVIERPASPLPGKALEETLSAEEIVGTLGAFTTEDADTHVLEQRIRSMVKGSPMEDMVPYILEQDRVVAMFLVSIAKKESDWGRRVPVLDGQDCFNYWGYRGMRKMMGTGGHTCFNSRKDAVATVGKRLQTLIHDNHLDTPAELILWKCGSSCAGHSSYSVRKWIADVDLYYQKLNETY